MNNEMIIAQMKEICRSREPEGKREFFSGLRARGLLHRRPVVMSHGEFLAGQLFYIVKLPCQKFSVAHNHRPAVQQPLRLQPAKEFTFAFRLSGSADFFHLRDYHLIIHSNPPPLRS
jgi:hypothetical protein